MALPLPAIVFQGNDTSSLKTLGRCRHKPIATQALFVALLPSFSTKGAVKQNGQNKEQSANQGTFLIFTTLCNNFPELPKLPVSAELQFPVLQWKVHPFYFASKRKLLHFRTTHIMFDLEGQPEVYCRLFVHVLVLVQRVWRVPAPPLALIGNKTKKPHFLTVQTVVSQIRLCTT